MAAKKSKPPKAVKPPLKRADAAEFARRVEAVLRIRLDGAQLHDLVAFAASQLPPWAVSERQLARYLEAADDLLFQRMERKRRRLIGLHMARRESLYARAVNSADYGTALRVLADMANLRGLYPAAKQKHEHTGAVAQVHVYIPDNGRDALPAKP